MNTSLRFRPDVDGGVLWRDGELFLCRGWRLEGDSRAGAALALLPNSDHPSPACLDRLAHEFGLRDVLDGDWVVRPLELAGVGAGSHLVLEDPGGEPLERLLDKPMDIGGFLRFAIGIAAAIGTVHQCGLVHKDLKPAHILVNCRDGQLRLTGFGLASRLPRERQAPAPPETIAGTLAYMAPEQTGRMNRSIDSRSDLYSLGVTFYQMLTGALPFSASDPVEWVHCHVARHPLAPSERLENVPSPLSHLVMKLLGKTPEERYQTAAGVEHDLQHCLTDWQRQDRIDDFPLGRYDTPDRLLIPERLYGREHEIKTLVACFDRVAECGAPELVLVSGYSGIGKSAVVNELHKVLVLPGGIFASGKFDQYKRDIPYATLAQAFQGVVRPLLSKSDSELAGWREALMEALGPNAGLITDLVPELKLIIGDPPPLPEFDPQQAQSRFQLVFCQFIGVFAQREHPLALFFDDLQWLDAGTIDLLEDLLMRSDVKHLMLIGAYRDNEVDSAHPLMRKLDVIRRAGARVQEIRLTPLAPVNLVDLITDALHCASERAAPLAQLVHEKTVGNPFFVIQFLYSLAEQGLLRFDHEALCWCWDLDGIHAKGYTDNVVDLMVGKLNRLPAETQRALQQLACVGNVAADAMLSIVLETAEEQVQGVLWPALRQELIERLDGSYRFMHDRVQEAAYSLIPRSLRAEVHLRIGRLLLRQTPVGNREEVIFEIVNQLNRGAALIDQQEELDYLAELNLIAGKRAKASTAYASALTYLNAGAALMAEDGWARRRELMFSLELNRAECELLTGRLSDAEERLAALSNRTTTTVERALAACLQMDVCATLGQATRAVDLCLGYLRQVGIECSPHPQEEDVRREYERIWSLLGSRTIEDLIDLPLMEDPASLATIDVLTKVYPPVLYTDSNLASLLLCKAASISLERGNCDASCVAYAHLGMLVGRHFGDYHAGFRFGQLGYQLVERRGLKRFAAGTYGIFAFFVAPWMKPVGSSSELLRRAFEGALKSGDLIFGAYLCDPLNSILFFAGESLSEVQAEAERGLAFAEKLRFGIVIDFITPLLRLVRMLRGLMPQFGCLDDGQFNERDIEDRLSSNPVLANAACGYWNWKLQARYIAGDYSAAIAAASKLQHLPWITLGAIEEAEYHLYAALAHAAYFDYALPEERPQHLDAIAAHHGQLQVWSNNCPANFESRAALVAAEIARLQGRDVDAMRLYEQAIRSARDSGFVHNEALCNETAARFYAARGFEKIARVYLQDARYGYLRWGAGGKVRQLEERYPQLRDEARAPDPTGTMATPLEHLDLATVIKVSQAVSSEMVLEKLIDTLMRTAIAQAGAARGLLILSHAAEPRIAAQASTTGEAVVVELHDAPVTSSVLPETVLHYVLRTRQSVILDDAETEAPYAADTYIRRTRARSILCVPLINQTKLVGVLYLENNLAPRVFAPTRITMLKLLASQAAIALENGRLYRDLAEREAKIRRLVDANIVGIFMWEFEGRIIEANDEFLRMIGYDRNDLLCGRLDWKELTPPDWPEQQRSGTLSPVEKEYYRKDGGRVPVLMGLATFDEGGNQGVAFVLDLTDRKQAERSARESEQRYHDSHLQLAHANRVLSIGELSASITHELNQPLSGIVINASTGLRMLTAEPPNVTGARDTLTRAIRDANRAAEVIKRLRVLFAKKEAQSEWVDLNEVVREVIALSVSENVRMRIELRTELDNDLPLVRGDRVQLQQVVLNFLRNASEAMIDVEDQPRLLTISTAREPGGAARVQVRDVGVGFEPQGEAKLFQSFYTTKSEGMGIGLSVSRSIIENHRGRIWAEANEGPGATFSFSIPLQSDSSSDDQR